MKQLTCEMCGSTDLIKQDGVFVCQTCGCKYSIEEARKMMVEGTVEVAGTVKVDNTGLIDSYLQMAENALEADNYSEAEGYANKIIEIDPRSWRAWFIKGKASGWQTTGRNNRYSESFINWINAYQYAPDDERTSLRDSITLEAQKISLALLQMECKNFARYQSEDNAEDIKKTVALIEGQLSTLKDKTEAETYTSVFQTMLARAINTAAINGSNSADKDFGTDHRYQNERQWDKFRFAQDRCLGLLDKAYELSYDDDLSHTICKNYIEIDEEVRDSCSYTYSNGKYIREYSLNDTAKQIRNDRIAEWKKKKAFHSPSKRNQDFLATYKKCAADVAFIEESAARRKYWDEHRAEKESLDMERNSLKTQIADLKAQKDNAPQLERRDSLKANIRSMNKELSSLGIFKGKEKKEIQSRIEAAKTELEQLKVSYQALESQLNTQIASLDKRVSEIDTELATSRGRTPISHGTTPPFFASDNSELQVSPIELLHYLSEKLPDPFNLKTGTEEDITNVDKAVYVFAQAFSILSSALNGKTENTSEYVDDPTKTKNYSISIHKGEESTNYAVQFRAKSINAPIEEGIRFKLNTYSFDIEEAASFVSIVSILLFDLFPSVELDDFQKVIAGSMYGITDSQGFATDGLKVNTERKNGVVLILSKR